MKVTILAVQVNGQITAFAGPYLLPLFIVALGNAGRGQLHGNETFILLSTLNFGKKNGRRVFREGKRSLPGEHLVVNLGIDAVFVPLLANSNKTSLGSSAANLGLGQDGIADLVGTQHILTGCEQGVVAYQRGGKVTAEGQVEVAPVGGPGGGGARCGHLHGTFGHIGVIGDFVDSIQACFGAGKHQCKAQNHNTEYLFHNCKCLGVLPVVLVPNHFLNSAEVG